ncbi:hypothetical protein CPB86DRAFT_782666 [Serendipita vermifera]|nr:hypothetical protein CPB86DRAFT_782666 [Serendipita vermifera]
MGYREGITAGKESALQEGFDEGFEKIGAPIGRELGYLRGIVHALSSTLEHIPTHAGSEISRSQLATDLQELIQRLNRLRLKDLAPRDLQAEAHAREHRDTEVEGTDDALASALAELETKERPNGIEELAAIKEQVSRMLQTLDLSPTTIS